MKLYTELPLTECLAGDTLPGFSIAVTDEDDVPLDMTGCTMHLILAPEDDCTHAALVKACEAVQDGFAVTVTSAETAKLRGMYLYHFALQDAAGLVHRQLCGRLWVHLTAQGGIA